MYSTASTLPRYLSYFYNLVKKNILLDLLGPRRHHHHQQRSVSSDQRLVGRSPLHHVPAKLHPRPGGGGSAGGLTGEPRRGGDDEAATTKTHGASVEVFEVSGVTAEAGGDVLLGVTLGDSHAHAHAHARPQTPFTRQVWYKRLEKDGEAGAVPPSVCEKVETAEAGAAAAPPGDALSGKGEADSAEVGGSRSSGNHREGVGDGDWIGERDERRDGGERCGPSRQRQSLYEYFLSAFPPPPPPPPRLPGHVPVFLVSRTHTSTTFSRGRMHRGGSIHGLNGRASSLSTSLYFVTSCEKNIGLTQL